MRRTATVSSAVAVVLLSAGPHAQAKPNFSGKWVLDAEKTAAAAPAAAAGGVSPITISMNATTLKITVPSKDGSGTTTTYKLDGSDHKTIVMSRDGKTTEQVSKATIEGAKVVVKSTGSNGETAATWYVDGQWLVNERTSKAGTFRTFYKKG
jgi:VCBS repeat-containing protein